MVIHPGSKIINAKNTETSFGSVGGQVFYDGNMYVITCFHCVFQNEMKWTDRNPRVNNTVKFEGKRGYFEGGVIAHTSRSRYGDLALIKLNNEFTSTPDVHTFGKVDSFRLTSSLDKYSTVVKKYGAKSGETHGTFWGIAPSIRTIMYPGINYSFSNLLIIKSKNNIPFAEKGDSGSFVLDSTNSLIGIIVLTLVNYSFAISTDYLLDIYPITLS